jgi:hypothetical protein
LEGCCYLAVALVAQFYVRSINMERKPQEKFVTLYDTAKKCLLILDHLYSDFERATLLATDTPKVEADSSIVTEIYIAALGLVDYLHRFHEIVRAMPLLRKDLPELKKLKEALIPVQNCRNYLQHMHGDLMSNDSITYPILGAISWIHEGRNYILFSNQATVSYSAPGIVYDRFSEKYICKYQLTIGGHEIQLDIVYTQVKSFWTWLEKVAVIQPPQIKDYAWGKPTIIY